MGQAKKEIKLISLVIPVFNEQANVRILYETVLRVLEPLEERYNFELLFTDNHSVDSTFSILKELHSHDSRIRVFRFSRNFGYQKSILAGYLRARGDALIQLDCDLQDPPELIPEFLNQWENGAAVVYGIRRTRKEGVLIHMARRIFYRVANYLSDDELPVDVGDFRLVDRKVVESLRQFDDQQPYLRGAVAAMGFKQVGIPYDRRDRQHGSSNFKFKDLLNLAIDGILNHSVVPLRLSSYFGFILTVVTLLAVIGYAGARVIFNFDWPEGFTTLAVLLLGGIGINALFLGIIGEYLGRIYQQVKKRPLVIVDASLDSVPLKEVCALSDDRKI
jgi:polyisoprenyl-phosphate glycosyltransferase